MFQQRKIVLHKKASVEFKKVGYIIRSRSMQPSSGFYYRVRTNKNTKYYLHIKAKLLSGDKAFVYCESIRRKPVIPRTYFIDDKITEYNLEFEGIGETTFCGILFWSKNLDYELEIIEFELIIDEGINNKQKIQAFKKINNIPKPVNIIDTKYDNEEPIVIEPQMATIVNDPIQLPIKEEPLETAGVIEPDTRSSENKEIKPLKKEERIASIVVPELEEIEDPLEYKKPKVAPISTIKGETKKEPIVIKPYIEEIVDIPIPKQKTAVVLGDDTTRVIERITLKKEPEPEPIRKPLEKIIQDANVVIPKPKIVFQSVADKQKIIAIRAKQKRQRAKKQIVIPESIVDTHTNRTEVVFPVLYKMSNTPKVSIIMCVYNKEATLENAIQSILRQTYPNIELVIVDDGSTDRSKEIIDIYKNNLNIVYIENNENNGCYVSRNIGLRKCTGDFIAIQDADDISLSTRIERQIRTMITKNTAMCGCKMLRTHLKKIDYIDDEYIMDATYKIREQHFNGKHYFQCCHEIFGFATLIFTRSVFNKLGYFMELKFGADMEYAERYLYYASNKIFKNNEDSWSVFNRTNINDTYHKIDEVLYLSMEMNGDNITKKYSGERKEFGTIKEMWRNKYKKNKMDFFPTS